MQRLGDGISFDYRHYRFEYIFMSCGYDDMEVVSESLPERGTEIGGK